MGFLRAGVGGFRSGGCRGRCAVALTMAAGLAKDRWADERSDQRTLAGSAAPQQPLSRSATRLLRGRVDRGADDRPGVGPRDSRDRTAIGHAVSRYCQTRLAIARELGVNVTGRGRRVPDWAAIRVDIRLIDGATNRFAVGIHLRTRRQRGARAPRRYQPGHRQRAAADDAAVGMAMRDEDRRPSHPQALDAYLQGPVLLESTDPRGHGPGHRMVRARHSARLRRRRSCMRDLPMCMRRSVRAMRRCRSSSPAARRRRTARLDSTRAWANRMPRSASCAPTTGTGPARRATTAKRSTDPRLRAGALLVRIVPGQSGPLRGSAGASA